MSSAIAASSKRAAISAYGLEIEEIAEQCAESDITVIVGYCERAADRVFNAASVIGLDRVIGKHRKQHLPYIGADRFNDKPVDIEPTVFEDARRKGRRGHLLRAFVRWRSPEPISSHYPLTGPNSYIFLR
jgi:predicted amidohydrolase